MANSAQTQPMSPGCQHIKTQAELDAMLAASACIHVDGDAEQSVKDWDVQRKADIAEAATPEQR